MHPYTWSNFPGSIYFIAESEGKKALFGRFDFSTLK